MSIYREFKEQPGSLPDTLPYCKCTYVPASSWTEEEWNFFDNYSVSFIPCMTATCPDQDNCPGDPLKTEPGICGCGNPETGDTDGDGALDCIDECPDDPLKTEPGECGCGNSESDGCCASGYVRLQIGGCHPAGDLPYPPFECPGVAVLTTCGLGTFESFGSYAEPVTDCFDETGPCNTSPVRINNGYGKCTCYEAIRNTGRGDGYSHNTFYHDGSQWPNCNALPYEWPYNTCPEDGCPTDGLKAEPGVCGCGVPDTDEDGNGVVDCLESPEFDFCSLDSGVCGSYPVTDDNDNGMLDCKETCSNPDNCCPCFSWNDLQGLSGLQSDACTRSGVNNYGGMFLRTDDWIKEIKTWGGAMMWVARSRICMTLKMAKLIKPLLIQNFGRAIS